MKKSLLLLVLAMCTALSAYAFSVGDTIAISASVGGSTRYLAATANTTTGNNSMSGLETNKTTLDEYCLWVVGGTEGNYTFYNLGRSLYKSATHYLYHNGKDICMSTSSSSWQSETSGTNVCLNFYYDHKTRYLRCEQTGGMFFSQKKYNWTTTDKKKDVSINIFQYLNYYYTSTEIYRNGTKTNDSYKYEAGCNGATFTYQVNISVTHRIVYQSETTSDKIDKSETKSFTVSNFSAAFTQGALGGNASITYNATNRTFTVTPGCKIVGSTTLSDVINVPFTVTYTDDEGQTQTRNISLDLPVTQITGRATPYSYLEMSLSPEDYNFGTAGGNQVFTLSATKKSGNALVLSDGTTTTSSETSTPYAIDMTTYSDPAYLLHSSTSDMSITTTTSNTVTVHASDASDKNFNPIDTLQVYYQYVDESGNKTFYYARAALTQDSKYSSYSFQFNHQKGATGRDLQSNGMQGVHTQTKVIYLPKNSSITLQLPETSFTGYERCYDYDTDGKPTGVTKPNDANWLGNNTTNRGWYKTGSDAAEPTFTMPDNNVHRIAIDVSNYTDYTSRTNEFTEPTLSYRVIYEIHPASEISSIISTCTGSKFYEEHELIAPTTQEVLLSTNFDYQSGGDFPNYYYNATTRVSDYTWYKDGVRINNPTVGNHTIRVSSAVVDTVVYTLKCNGYNIAKFTVDYQDINKVGPASIAECKNGVMYTDAELDAKYTLLTKRTFDGDDGYPTPSSSSYEVPNQPLAWDECTYGFMYPDKSNPSTNRNDGGPNNKPSTQRFAYWGEYLLVNNMANCSFLYAAQNVGGADKGYFIYCDATEMAGVVANLSLDAQLCAGSQMFCSAYVNNVATSGAAPVFEFEFIGEDALGGEHVLTTFNTGTITKRTCDQTKDNGWRQVFFAVKSDGNYEHYRLKIYDRTDDHSGNDFAIDDIRIYVSRPPVLAYQATTACASESSDTLAAVVRMDYQSLSGVDWQGKPIYYQWVNADSGDTLNIDYLDKNVAGKYGHCFFPADTAAIPQADRYPNIETFMAKRDTTPNLVLCYIRETNDDGKENYVMYVVHDAPMPAGYTYTLRMATDPSELDNTMCGMSTDLDIYGAAEITLNGSVEKESMYSDLCGNQIYRVAIALFNAERDFDNTIQLMRGHCLSDWLKGNPADSTDAACIAKYGYTYDQICQAITSDLRREYIDVVTSTSSYLMPNPNTTVTSLDQIQTQYLKFPSTLPIITHLVDEELLTLGQEYIDVFVPGDATAEFPSYTIFPIAGTGVNDTSGVAMGVCTDAKQIALGISSDRDSYQLVIGDRGEVLPAAILNESRGLRVTKSQLTGSLTLPVNNTNARAGVVELINSTDPSFVSSEKTPFTYTHNNAENIGETLVLTPSTTNTFTLKSGYDYMFEIHLKHPNGYDEALGCPIGSSYFTIYVIPDTVVWSPKGTNTAWNNDKNWDMYNGGVSAKGYVPNANANVIIPDLGTDGVYPVLPSDTATKDKQKLPTEAGAEDYITYDLNYVTHNCDKIHFEANAQLLNQHMLAYNQAWVEMAIPTNRWQMMSFPVTGVVAGDLYLPADSYASAKPFSAGNECTKRNDPYWFWQSLYNRNGVTKTEANGSVSVKNVSWSTPTNVVSYEYPVGSAGAFWCYNIDNVSQENLIVRLPKTDTQYSYFKYGESLFAESISRPEGAGKLGFTPTITSSDTVMTITLTNDTAGNLFLFGNPALAILDVKELIEANSDVLSGTFYYLPDDKTGDKLDMSVCTQYTATSTEYMLLPYRGVLLQTKSNATSLSLKVRPNMYMLGCQVDTKTQPILAPGRRNMRRASEENDVTLLCLTALMGDYYTSVVIGETSEADDAYVIGEDAELLTFADNTVETSSSHVALYTPVDNQALSVDIINDLQSVPLMFHYCNKSDYRDNFTLWFGDVDQFEGGLQFYDAQTQVAVPLMNGMMLELESSQPDEARYYIQRLGYKAEQGPVTHVDDLTEATISAYTQPGNRVCVVATDGLQNINVYTTSGQLVQKLQNVGATTTEFTMPQGVYMVKIETEQGNSAIRKVVVR